MMAAHPLEAASATTDRTAKGEIELSLRPGLQVEAEGMESAGELPVVVEVLVVIRLSVAVEVVVARDLVIGDGVDHIVHDGESQGFVPAGGDSFPGKFLQLLIDPTHDPDIPIPGAHRRPGGIAEKVETPDAHLHSVGVLVGHGQPVENVGSLPIVLGQLPGGGHGLGPAGGTALHEQGQIFQSLRHAPTPVDHLEVRHAHGNLQDNAAVYHARFPSGSHDLEPGSPLFISQHHHRRPGELALDGPGDETVLESREFQNRIRAHRIAQDGLVSVHIKSLVVSLGFGKGAEGRILAVLRHPWFGQAPLRVGPARRSLVGEHLGPVVGGERSVPSREGETLQLQPALRPARRHAHGVRIKSHAGRSLGIEPDDLDPEGHVVSPGILADPQRGPHEVAELLRQRSRHRLGRRGVRANRPREDLLVPLDTAQLPCVVKEHRGRHDLELPGRGHPFQQATSSHVRIVIHEPDGMGPGPQLHCAALLLHGMRPPVVDHKLVTDMEPGTVL